MLVGVVGGGLGGVSAALTLARTGHEVVVLEQAPQFEEIGAGIQLAPNATAVLDDLGVLDRLEEVAVFPGSLQLMNGVTGEQITSVDLGRSFLERYGHPYLVLHRADLLEALLQASRQNDRISLQSNREVVEVEDIGTAVRLVSADGQCELVDYVVGADGLWSRTRKLIVDDQPIRRQQVACRSTDPVSAMPQLNDLNDVLMWVGPGFHLVQYPLRAGAIINQVAVFHTEPVAGSDVATGSAEQLDERFAVACDTLQRDLVHIRRDRFWEMHEQAPLECWSEGRVTLLGDAAHAMLQYVAQGACQAFEDAACLGSVVEQYDGDIKAAVAAYEKARVARTASVQRAARNWGEICHLDGVASVLRDRLLGQRTATDYADLDWLFGYRVGRAAALELG